MDDLLWTAEELTAALGEDWSGELPKGVNGVSIDTRTLQPGDLFVAIRGERTDGHEYIEKAFEAGAALAVVEAGYDAVSTGALLRVADTLEALNALGRAGRQRSKARIVAVTGSVGKTGTKEMLRLMLSRLGSVHVSEKSYNNHWGVPLSLSRLPRDADYAVFEIGMNHAGEITPLTQMVRPNAAIITTIAPVHIEFFETVAAIAEAKAEIFAGVTPGGAVILNRDNEHYELLATRAGEAGVTRIVRFGSAGDAECRLVAINPSAEGSSVEAELFGIAFAYRLGAPGEHLAMNSLAAIAAIQVLGSDAIHASGALAEFGAPAGRGAQTRHTIDGGALLLIDEAYNANPASMSAALKVLGSLPENEGARRIAVLGDMLELGVQSDALHAGLATVIEENGVDLVYCSGRRMAALFAALPEARRGLWAGTSEALQQPLLEALGSGDAVMIKGSLGSRMGVLVEAIKTKFPQCTPPAKNAAA
ncbi:MAG: UDP-N-acetylmuramoylalanyl-D-glutamyl-2,6-diaminopimelate--D-alanyl-D-alanine ligase [Hyphomicrobiales bacterium]|nr:UDP-N-acetylmuramoylalanyl-D-glutamyl-2,6-diaminopimelate--D-alanyl-D-alanine ligase [Hyphomicrobiales bacterium]